MRLRSPLAPALSRSLRRIALGVLGLTAAGAFIASSGCGGATRGTPLIGGESHFLRWCSGTGSGSCGDGLECISGLCTRPCVVAEPNACSAFTSASCTAQSIEPGAVAVCDVSCAGNSDCAPLGADYGCAGGFCRAPELTSGSAGGGDSSPQSPFASGGSGGSSMSASPGTGGTSTPGGAGRASTPGPECADCLEGPTLSWTLEGGFVATMPASVLTRCNSYAHALVTVGADDPLGNPQCTTAVEGCPSRDLAVLNTTLQDPELQAGLTAQTVFGLDSRPVDGVVHKISVGNDSLFVGDPCIAGTFRCIEIPPAVSSLLEQLQALDALQLAKPPCADVFPGGTGN
jgi:hypothetical protein